MNEHKKFQKRIGVTFHDEALLRQAFTHRSFVNEVRDENLEHNERLEFLGDAVLELVTTHFLYEKYPKKPEGELTAVRAALVNTTSLSATALGIGVNDCLLLSKGEAKDVGRARQYILANSYEAIVGAMYLDSGYDVVRKFISETLLGKTDDIVKKKLWQDAKSRFQEEAQERVSTTPSYETVGAEGPDHDRQFTVAVYLGNNEIAQGTGKSKQEAEQEAAHNALEEKGW